MKRPVIAIATTVTILLTLLSQSALFIHAESSVNAPASDINEDTSGLFILGYPKENGYANYDKANSTLTTPLVDIRIAGDAYTEDKDASVTKCSSYEGVSNCASWESEQGSITYTVTVPETGRYRIALGYYPDPSSTANVELALAINGQTPFVEAETMSFERIWVDESEITQDNRGNELRPMQTVLPQWMENDCRDKEGLVSDSFLFVLQKGGNAITFSAIRESFILGYVRIYNEDSVDTYKQYRAKQDAQSITDYESYYQGEDADRKSDSSLYPISDRTSSATVPYHYSKIRMNTIGGSNWNSPGQWLEWDITVPISGWYTISLRERQNLLRGLNSYRRISIDGSVPFSEMEDAAFSYSGKWRVTTLGDGTEAYQFYLTAGETHTLRMEAVVGDTGDVITQIEKCVYDLNYIYRKIIMITGVTPDIYRDFDIDQAIPELQDEFNRIAAVLETQLSNIEETIGKKSPEAAILNEMSEQLRSLAKKPDSLSERLENYKTNISTLSEWVTSAEEQPLEIDWIRVASSDMENRDANESIGDTAKRVALSFFASFVEDYDSIGNVAEDGSKALTVWVGSGREQAQIVKTMIDDTFTEQTGISVNVSLVQGSLMEATMAGQGPDIALNVARYLTVDLAARGALLCLSDRTGFQELTGEYQDTAFVPYTLNGKVYGIPETQEYNMLFYRADIFEELGIKPPSTWEELYALIPIIERNNMDVGLPSLTTQAAGDYYTPFPKTLPTLLIQNGLGWYNDTITQTTLSSSTAMDCWTKFIELYRDYGLPVYFDFSTRFRTGEMPMGIASFTTYNYLYISAPEIRGMWEMTPVPGTVQKDDTVDNREEGYGMGCVVFSKVAEKNREDDAFQLVKWWAGSSVHTRYGREMESILGPAGRYATANLKAFENMPWSASEEKVLKSQWNNVVEQPEIPGSYFLSRNLANATIEAVYDGTNPLKTLKKYNDYINEELERKRTELGLE